MRLDFNAVSNYIYRDISKKENTINSKEYKLEVSSAMILNIYSNIKHLEDCSCKVIMTSSKVSSCTTRRFVTAMVRVGVLELLYPIKTIKGGQQKMYKINHSLFGKAFAEIEEANTIGLKRKTNTMKVLLAILEDKGRHTVCELKATLGLSHSTVQSKLNKLMTDGVAERERMYEAIGNKTTHWYEYSLV